jgi:hypothetical protein
MVHGADMEHGVEYCSVSNLKGTRRPLLRNANISCTGVITCSNCCYTPALKMAWLNSSLLDRVQMMELFPVDSKFFV